jgi:NAD(P)-dependent dehydrogenase (short-subunit alcohol dehydrogenase family)
VRAVLPVMRRQGYGRIVVTSSMSGRHGNRNLAHYCASKFGLIGMAKAVALDVAGTGITVNVMCPTAVNTPMLINDMTFALFCPDIEHPTLEDAKPRFAGQNPLGVPWMEPDTFTRAIIYLVTDPGFVTGSVLEVSAGASAALP